MNRNINFTDKCTGTCRFCAFRNHVGYFLTTDEILARVEGAKRFGATEVCIQGGLQPDMYLNDYVSMLEAIKSKYEIDIHAFSPMEVYHMSKTTGVTVAHSLNALKEAGLCSMPGTAAEVLDDGIRAEICPGKLNTKDGSSVVTTARQDRHTDHCYDDVWPHRDLEASHRPSFHHQGRTARDPWHHRVRAAHLHG